MSFLRVLGILLGLVGVAGFGLLGTCGMICAANPLDHSTTLPLVLELVGFALAMGCAAWVWWLIFKRDKGGKQ